MTRHWTALPNFVDCAVFRPSANTAEKRVLRVALGFPPDALVVISVAALKRGHKRVDHVIKEFKAAARRDAFLVLAGAATGETPGLLALAAGDPRIRIIQNHPHERIAELLRAADVMVLGSLFEMMPIAILEGLASGLPVITNDHPVMTWMTGAAAGVADHRLQTTDLNAGGASLRSEVCGLMSEVFPPLGGMAIDMSREGALAEALDGLTPEWIAEHGRQARERALGMFSKDVVIRQYVENYRRVCGGRLPVVGC